MNKSARPADVLPEWRIGRRLRDCSRVFNAALQRRLDRFELRVSDWAHLRVISDQEGQTQVEISRRLKIEKASSTAVLEKLKKAGLIEGRRQPGDRRKIGIYLSDDGDRLMERLIPEVLSVIEAATASITDAEMAAFVQTIARMIANIEAWDGTQDT